MERWRTDFFLRNENFYSCFLNRKLLSRGKHTVNIEIGLKFDGEQVSNKKSTRFQRFRGIIYIFLFQLTSGSVLG